MMRLQKEKFLHHICVYVYLKSLHYHPKQKEPRVKRMNKTVVYSFLIVGLKLN